MLLAVTYYVIPSFLLILMIRKYRERNWSKCKNTVKLDGKVAIVTGANSGIGYEIAKDLAGRNALVIVTCRTIQKADDTIRRLKQSLKNNPQLVPMQLELNSLKSIKEFAAKVKQSYPEINLLINNAGVSHPQDKRLDSEDGFEVHFAVNYLGPFYLTNLLLPLISKNSDNRIVVVISSLYEKGKISLDSMNTFYKKSERNLYADSKLGAVYFCNELLKRTENSVKVFAVSPGWVYTSLFRYSIKWYHYILVAPIALFFMRSAVLGAQTPIYCATEPSLESSNGFLYRDCKKYNSKVILYDAVSKELWDKTEILINAALSKI